MPGECPEESFLSPFGSELFGLPVWEDLKKSRGI